MDELVRWLGVQLDEDERIARAVPADLGHSWSDPGPWVMAGNGGGGREAEVAKAADGLDTQLAEHVAHHIAYHDPARVLREVAAKRQIIERCTRVQGLLLDDFSAERLVDDVLALLALAYAGRPGYREEWRP
ncbi:DUF6221 family protein [Streptomyces sp. PAM3C]|uniref:DUF6221 family protein n=1 Tax=Streptomyces sp. PAM3C TaxID=2847300 RepID=UPI001C1E668E|nr:DUF6221 family protein [Streptomyces sp. PAM3C]MBU5946776.1 hypothetical protein [Streptomyces sp. PAM3C]